MIGTISSVARADDQTLRIGVTSGRDVLVASIDLRSCAGGEALCIGATYDLVVKVKRAPSAAEGAKVVVFKAKRQASA